MTELAKPRLWSDLDYTALRLMSIMPGYVEFLLGAQEGGVKFAGIVTRRPAIFPCQIATARSVGRLGLSQHFPDAYQLILAGSERKKAQIVADESRQGVVGMIDNKPHWIGMALVGIMLANQTQESGDVRREIVLGAVDHSRSHEHIGQLADSATKMHDVNVYDALNEVHIEGADFGIHVVSLKPYSVEAGLEFASMLTELNDTRQSAEDLLVS